MKILITPEWLKNKIENEPNLPCEAGNPIDMFEYKEERERLKEEKKMRDFREKTYNDFIRFHMPID